jgi:hypothetical protein
MTVPVSDLIFPPWVRSARLLWGSHHVSHTVFLYLLWLGLLGHSSSANCALS